MKSDIRHQNRSCIANYVLLKITGRAVHSLLTTIDMVFQQKFCLIGESLLFELVEKLLHFHKGNTTFYHPQTDGMVKRFNRTLIAMLAKTTEKGGQDWDHYLPYILIAHRAAEQQSTLESSFFCYTETT